MIRDAAVFSLNEIVMRRQGFPLFDRLAVEDEIAEPGLVPAETGVYLLAVRTAVLTYPIGGSRIVYIGKADRSNTLKNRLGEHFTFTKQRRNQRGDVGRMYSRYEWTAINGIQASWAAVPTKDVKNLENDLLYWFGEMYGAVPLGNAQSAWAESRSDSPA